MNAYGQTEATSAITFLGPDDHRLEGSPEEVALKERRLRSVGRVMDDVDLAIQAPDGTILPAGREGEICVRSGRTMKGYYKQEAGHPRGHPRRLAAHRRRGPARR